MLFMVVLIVEVVDVNVKSYLYFNESCWIGESFFLILFFKLNNVILIFEFLGEILKCYYLNESKLVLFFFDVVYFVDESDCNC